MANGDGLFDTRTRRASDRGDRSKQAGKEIGAVIASGLSVANPGNIPETINDHLNSIYLQRGHIFSDSHVQARYQWVLYKSTYYGPQGLVVLPRAALSGDAVAARRHAPLTLQLVEWKVLRFKIAPELPKVETDGKKLLNYQLSGHSNSVLTDGKTMTFWLEGSYRYVITSAKDITSATFKMPNNPALDPLAAKWEVKPVDFYEGSIP